MDDGWEGGMGFCVYAGIVAAAIVIGVIGYSFSPTAVESHKTKQLEIQLEIEKVKAGK